MKDATRVSDSTVRKRNRQSGFTLIEVLVSLGIAGLVLGLLGNTVYSFAEGWRRQSALIEQQDMVRRGIGILRRDLRSLQRAVIADDASPRLAFEADAASLSFVTLAPGYPGKPGPIFVRYSIERTDAARRLVRRSAPYRADAAPSNVVYRNAVVILSGDPGPQFSYRAEAAGSAPTWQSRWQRTDALPAIVQLRFSGTGVTRYPAAMIAIRAQAEQACVDADAPPCMLSLNSRDPSERAQ